MKKQKDYPGKIKLYADENIRIAIVKILRDKGINIIHASEEGLLRRDDQAHFQFAKKTGRWLLTTDRDFLDNNRFPFEHIKGIVIVPHTGDDLIAGKILAWIRRELIPSGKGIQHCKAEFRDTKVIFHFRVEGMTCSQTLDI